MILVKNVESLNFEVSLLEKRRKTLRALFDRGRISHNTFDLLDKRISKIESLIISLKDAVQEETEFWDTMVSEETRILESMLVDFKFLNLMGEINVNEWEKISKTISLGIEFLNRKSSSECRENVFEADVKEALTTIEFKDGTPPLLKKKFNLKKRKRKYEATNMRVNRKATRIEVVKSSDSHCMNPWKPECKRTNIKLSIYYNGQFLPICEECWKEISKRNIEWST